MRAEIERPELDLAALRAMVGALHGLRRLPRDTVDGFGALVAELPAAELWRANPLAIAARHGLDPATALELYVHGARVGLFDLSWNAVCVFCGAVELFHDSIDDLPPSHFHCTPCDADIDVLLDERVEVTFSLNAAIGRLDIDPYADVESYLRWFTSPWVTPSAEARAFFQRYRLGFIAPGAGRSGELSVELTDGDRVRLVSYDRHVSADVRASAGATARDVAFQLLPTSFAPDAVTVAPGRVRLAVHNRCDGPAGVLLLAGDAHAQQHVVETHRATLEPYVTGRMLLNTQSFRDLFRVTTHNAHLALRLRHVTVLFTDLCGSTALYDRLGDAAAYQIVREHLAAIAASTRAHGGAVVKTIGDAVMAGFDAPRDAMRAALEMQRRVPGQVKIGLHGGPALVINAEDRLDYFGHTVNVASRVQELAAGGQICFTQAIHDAPGVREALAGNGDVTSASSTAIRGLAEPMTVYRLAVT